jgi:glycosyltransferase involved in cell wall biosynthesis
MFTVVIPFFNGHQYIHRLLSTIPTGINVLIIDDLSDKPLENAGNAKIIRLDKKGYFTGAVNRGLQETTGDVLILNQDTYFTSNEWIGLIEANKKEYGLIGEGVAKHPAWPKGYIHGTFMFIRRDVISQVGMMNEEWYPLWGSTCDYQTRACRKGFKALPIPQGQVPGFNHVRVGKTGSSITELLKTENKRGLFIRTPPMISVVINCYNHGQFLEDAVNSLIGGKTCLGQMSGQSFQAFEIIIVDDGSTDNTAEIGQRLANDWQGIHYYWQRNQGSPVAMNTGISKAFGKYIAPLDADDMMRPNRLETMLRVIEKNPHSAIYDGAKYFSQASNGKWVDGWHDGWKWQEGLELLKPYNFEEILYQNGMHKGLLYPKAAWDEVGGYPAVMNRGREDWAFNVALGLSGYCGVHTGQSDYLYRRNWTSRTFTNTTPEWRRRFLEQMQELYPDVYQRGVRPNMCCGGGRNKTVQKQGVSKMSVARKKSEDLPGAKDGMVILEYNGKNAGDESWVGLATRQVYIFGGVQKRGYVDRRDAGARPTRNSNGNGFLAMREDNRYVFNEWFPSIVPKEPETLLVEIQESYIQESYTRSYVPPTDNTPAINFNPTLDIVDTILNPADFSLTEIKVTVTDLTVTKLEAMLESEKSNKNRSTVIKAIKKELNARVV